MRQVAYLMSGPAHLPYLVASLATLREHWDGAVHVYCYPESVAVGRRIGVDSRLKVFVHEWEPTYRGKNGQFLNKIHLLQRMQGRTLYLDADTTIHADPTPLFDLCPSRGFVATQFNSWTAQSRTISHRVQRLLKYVAPLSDCARMYLDTNLPSVNGGVVVSDYGNPAVKTWADWTQDAIGEFIADETVLHAVMVSSAHNVDFRVAPPGWNVSPKYKPVEMQESDVKIFHYHGDCNTRPTKSPYGAGLWLPKFDKCLATNLGGMAEWWTEIGNDFLYKVRPNAT